MRQTRRRVTLRSGRVVNVAVSGPLWAVKARFPLEAPSTRRLEPVASIDRGDNYHGDLSEQFYLAPNTPVDPSAWVLWIAACDSQYADDVERVIPIAWCRNSGGPGEDWISEEDAVFALMSAWIGEVVEGYEGWYSAECPIEGSHLLGAETLLELLGRPSGVETTKKAALRR